MIIHTMEALRALKHFDIHAQTQYVNSAEDAIACAERRDADRPRLEAIAKHPVITEARSPAKLAVDKPFEDEQAIRQSYNLLVHESGTFDARILAQAPTERAENPAGTSTAARTRLAATQRESV